ncbi:hypothetical protein [Acidovorax sp. BLS4]|uniref:hypothetical protein n=1 Tax=Acidovorax sp. BLS4 TaxID=3273430 RepID=UPI002943D5AE|nr:hypothetical protein [Paracidovorax avenae]WOI43797.1 hypothetical protein R1Z03_14755 [Paracidovorax avenae]
MTAGIYTYVATAIGAGLLAAAGTWQVQDWRWTANTQAADLERQSAQRQADEARASDARQQRRFNDTAAGRHAATVAGITTQLLKANDHIATLSGDRQCLGGSTVRVLNTIGTPARGVGLRIPAGQSPGAASAAAGSTADDAGAFASERDTAAWIATCRARYGQVSDQLNEILDIEDRRGGVHTSAQSPSEK